MIAEWMERQKERRASNRLLREFARIFANDLPRILRQRGRVPAADPQPCAGDCPPGLAPPPEVRRG